MRLFLWFSNTMVYFIWISWWKSGHFIIPKIAYLPFSALQFGSGNEPSKSCWRIAFEFGLRPPCHGWLGIGRTTLHSMSGFGTQQPSSYCQYETTQQPTQLVFLFWKKLKLWFTVVKNISKKSHHIFILIFENSNAINIWKWTLWKHCVNETFLEIFNHCALLCISISKQWKNVPKAIIDFRDMEKNTYTKEFEKSCTNALLLFCEWPS